MPPLFQQHSPQAFLQVNFEKREPIYSKIFPDSDKKTALLIPIKWIRNILAFNILAGSRIHVQPRLKQKNLCPLNTYKMSNPVYC